MTQQQPKLSRIRALLQKIRLPRGTGGRNQAV